MAGWKARGRIPRPKAGSRNDDNTRAMLAEAKLPILINIIGVFDNSDCPFFSIKLKMR